jgi:hypothetical protein
LQGAEGEAGFYSQIAQMDQRFTDEIEHRYAPLDCPVTLLWGEEDQWIPISRGHALAAKLTREVLADPFRIDPCQRQWTRQICAVSSHISHRMRNAASGVALKELKSYCTRTCWDSFCRLWHTNEMMIMAAACETDCVSP